MKLENQVISLELAKKLKELGVKQESLFYWVAMVDSEQLKFCDWKYLNDYNFTSAFTVAELGEILPGVIEKEYGKYSQYFILNCGRSDPKVPNNKEYYDISYQDWSDTDEIVGVPKLLKYIEEKPEADARAQMLIYLIENNLINL